jgi:hypothetical protein
MHWWGAGLANLPSAQGVYRTNLGLSSTRHPAPICPSTPDGGDPSWIPGFPFGHLPSDRPEAPIALFEMPELGTMLRSPAPSLRLEALVEQSYSACYKYPSTPFSVVLASFHRFQSPLILLAREGVLKRQFYLQGVHGVEYTEGTKKRPAQRCSGG